MRKLHPMTDEERAFAETWHPLVLEFLHHRKLPEADYYDVVIFGFLSAVQQYVRSGPTTEADFTAMAFRSMKDAVLRDLEYHGRQKRTAVVLSLDGAVDGCDGITLAGAIPDPAQDTAIQAESNAVAHQARQMATDKEAVILFFVTKGYSVTEAARSIGITPNAASCRIGRFRRRARAAVAV